MLSCVRLGKRSRNPESAARLARIHIGDLARGIDHAEPPRHAHEHIHWGFEHAGANLAGHDTLVTLGRLVCEFPRQLRFPNAGNAGDQVDSARRVLGAQQVVETLMQQGQFGLSPGEVRWRPSCRPLGKQGVSGGGAHGAILAYPYKSRPPPISGGGPRRTRTRVRLGRRLSPPACWRNLRRGIRTSSPSPGGASARRGSAQASAPLWPPPAPPRTPSCG